MSLIEYTYCYDKIDYLYLRILSDFRIQSYDSSKSFWTELRNGSVELLGLAHRVLWLLPLAVHRVVIDLHFAVRQALLYDGLLRISIMIDSIKSGIFREGFYPYKQLLT